MWTSWCLRERSIRFYWGENPAFKKYASVAREELKHIIKDKQKELLSFEEWKKEKGSADSRTSASNSERSGAISGNSSSNGLLHESSGHLSRYSLASQEDIAKLLKILK